MQKQTIEMYIFTGPNENVGAAIEYCTKHKLKLSTVGPRTLGKANRVKDSQHFILLAEKVVR